jgi:membrane protein DedA with SNARE-associated domain
VFRSLVDLVSGSPFTYGFLFLIAALDAVFPLVPSETAVITAGVIAADGGLLVPVVILAAAVGAIVGDNVSYWVGRRASGWLERHVATGERRKRIVWAERMLDERGGYLIVVARFIPGGRTAVTLAAGLLHMPWRRFIAFDVAAGLLWGSYATLIGYFGGKAFEEEPLKGLLLALVIAFAIAAVVETVRWLRKRRLARS